MKLWARITLLMAFPLMLPSVTSAAAERQLRVCADPNNLPFSNDKGEGFENKVAKIVAEELDAELSYLWWAQRRGFIRNTLNAQKCDLVMGVPARYELVLTTRPYYRSAYVYVYRQDRKLDLHSMRDPRLRDLRIGVHLVGDDGNNPPPAHALGLQNIVDNVSGFLIYGDYQDESPPARLIEAVARGDVDVAAVWGPTGGYFARQSKTPLTVKQITDTSYFRPLRFEFSIAMGVRKGDQTMRDELNAVLDRRQEEIRELVESYGVPLVEEKQATSLERAAAE